MERKVDNLRTEFEEFREETRDNFHRLENRLERDTKSLNKRDARREKEMTDLQVEVEDLAERVQVLEQKAT